MAYTAYVCMNVGMCTLVCMYVMYPCHVWLVLLMMMMRVMMILLLLLLLLLT